MRQACIMVEVLSAQLDVCEMNKRKKVLEKNLHRKTKGVS